MDWVAIGAIGNLTVVIVAATTLIIQNKQFRKTRADEKERSFKDSSVQLILSFDEQFVDLTDLRLEISTLVLRHDVLKKSVIDNYAAYKGAFEEIYDFFDTLGFYVREEYIKAEVVYQYFYYWFSHYYEFYKLYNIKHLSGYEDSTWTNLALLSQKLDAIEEKQLGRKVKVFNKNMLLDFFKKEKDYLQE